MRALIGDLDAWRAAGDKVAAATVVETWGSAPRKPGGALLIGSGGQLAGSVSGGCVEGAVIEAARDVLDGGDPRMLRFDVADDDAMAVGLPCGGRIRVFVELLSGDHVTEAWLDALRVGRPVARLVGLSGAWLGKSVLAVRSAEDALEIKGALRTELNGDPPSSEAVVKTLTTALSGGDGRTLELADELFFVGTYPARDRLVIVGAVHIAQPLVRLSRELGYHITLVDARETLATPERFPDVDALHVEWPATLLERMTPDASTDVVVLSHDDKLDDPAIAAALRSPARYVGALGSRKRTAARAERLLKVGVTKAELEALDAPIGLDIGARTPEEIAVSILARLVEVRRG